MRDLNADLKICEAATPGPWEQRRLNGECVYNPEADFNVCMTRRAYDAEFIAAARTGWPEAIKRAMAAHNGISFRANWRKDGELTTNLNFDRGNIGKTVFPTREEAEAALRRNEHE